uniref:Uncharacterized protein n=1 Tax=Oryza punctata TaxID=4537 RepID=A0A0E0K8U7_ORYPU
MQAGQSQAGTITSRRSTGRNQGPCIVKLLPLLSSALLLSSHRCTVTFRWSTTGAPPARRIRPGELGKKAEGSNSVCCVSKRHGGELGATKMDAPPAFRSSSPSPSPSNASVPMVVITVVGILAAFALLASYYAFVTKR